MAQRHGRGRDPLSQSPGAESGATSMDLSSCCAPLTPRCSKGVKQLLLHICHDHEPCSWEGGLGDHGSEAPAQPRRQQDSCSMRQCPANWQHCCQPAALSCPVGCTLPPLGFSLQPQGPNCSLGVGGSPPHCPSLSTLWCGLAAHRVNRNPLSWKNRVYFSFQVAEYNCPSA